MLGAAVYLQFLRPRSNQTCSALLSGVSLLNHVPAIAQTLCSTASNASHRANLVPAPGYIHLPLAAAIILVCFPSILAIGACAHVEAQPFHEA